MGTIVRACGGLGRGRDGMVVVVVGSEKLLCPILVFSLLDACFVAVLPTSSQGSLNVTLASFRLPPFTLLKFTSSVSTHTSSISKSLNQHSIAIFSQPSIKSMRSACMLVNF